MVALPLKTTLVEKRGGGKIIILVRQINIYTPFLNNRGLLFYLTQ